MLLSDRDIIGEIADNRVVITPYDPDLIQPASVDLRLDGRFRVYEQNILTAVNPLDPASAPSTRLVECTELLPLVLRPDNYVLGTTLETIGLPDDIAGRVEGVSTLGRLGLQLHLAGWVDPGFTGQVTLELKNVAPHAICLVPGMVIGQLCLFRLSSPAIRPYGADRLGSRYQGQTGPTAAVLRDRSNE